MVSGRFLAQLLRISKVTLFRWRDSGHLVPDAKDGEGVKARLLYLHSTVDRFLAAFYSQKDQSPPTLAQLLAYRRTGQSGRRPSLWTLEEVHVWFGWSQRGSVHHHVSQGNLLAFDFPGRGLTRVLASSVMAFTARRRETVTIPQVAQIIGMVPPIVRRLIRAGKLATTSGRGEEGQLIAIAELEAFLAPLLGAATPQEWIRLRRIHGYEPLLTIEEAVRLGASRRRLQRAIRQNEICTIRTPGATKSGHYRIPLHALQAWRAQSSKPVSRPTGDGR